MGVWSRHVFPRLCHLAMRGEKVFGPLRRETLAEASGRVLEIGLGTGLNLRQYPAAVGSVDGVDPNPGMARLARAAAADAPFTVELHLAGAERLPFPDGSFDTAVSTWTLCSVADVPAALTEIARVLRPGGRFLFLEHGRSHEPRVARWQRRLTPIQRRVAGGCHLDRDFERLVGESPLAVDRVDRFYAPDLPKLGGYLYRGTAVRT